ncbi:ferric reductase-like transmembrane domain-containing protein [bacterium]|nr:ferric reductase-like transmembrane domain-containing protein [bacterium]
MTNQYRAVQWNAHKKTYDFLILLGVLVLIVGFVGTSVVLAQPNTDLPSPEILVLRALGTGAATLLTLTLCIGPLARLDRRFAPLLYNRRHLGVTVGVLALLHGFLATNWYHGFGVIDPLVSLLSSGSEAPGVPFQPLGLLALIVLLIMAATSHDYWLNALGARIWKGLHMLVYPAWLLVIAHVAFGAMQTDTSPLIPGLLGLAILGVGGLHLVAGIKGRAADSRRTPICDGWLDAGPLQDILDGGARQVVKSDGAPIAVFRQGKQVSAISGVCRHQGGPLAEGRIVDGCVTCPWHGYQYRPTDGTSPPPYEEKLETHKVEIRNGNVLVDPQPQPPGTHIDPAEAQQ